MSEPRKRKWDVSGPEPPAVAQPAPMMQTAPMMMMSGMPPFITFNPTAMRPAAPVAAPVSLADAIRNAQEAAAKFSIPSAASAAPAKPLFEISREVCGDCGRLHAPWDAAGKVGPGCGALKLLMNAVADGDQ